MGGKLRSGSRRAKQRNNTGAKAQFNRKPKREAKKATKGVFEGIAYDSLGELAFLQWAKELAVAGYIKSLERAEGFLLSDALQVNYVEQLKTKSKPMQQTILHGHSYTPEFKIIWNKKAFEKFVQDSGDGKRFDKLFIGKIVGDYGVTYVEIKPLFDFQNTTRMFVINQKWMLQKHNIFVNLVKCPELFSHTFTPVAYLTTPSGFKRKIKWKPRGLYSYINGRS
jgi:hypothetical protein